RRGAPADPLLPCVGRRVLLERLDLGRSGRQAGEVEVRAADERTPVRERRGGQTAAIEFPEAEGIDRVPDLCALTSDLWDRRFLHRLEGPVLPRVGLRTGGLIVR